MSVFVAMTYGARTLKDTDVEGKWLQECDCQSDESREAALKHFYVHMPTEQEGHARAVVEGAHECRKTLFRAESVGIAVVFRLTEPSGEASTYGRPLAQAQKRFAFLS